MQDTTWRKRISGMSMSWASPGPKHEGSSLWGEEWVAPRVGGSPAPRAHFSAQAREAVGLSNSGAPARASTLRKRNRGAPERGAEYPSNKLFL